MNQEKVKTGTPLADYQFHYGKGQLFSFTLDESEVIWSLTGPPERENVTEAIEQALRDPLDYPQVHQAVVPGDRIAIIVDPETPAWPEIVKTLGRHLEARGIEPQDMRVSLNTDQNDRGQSQEKESPYQVLSHKEVMKGRSIYLASTAEGERIYLPEEIGDADYVITISRFGFDDHLGFRGTHSSVFPAFAEPKTRKRFHREGHRELSPENSRGVRQQIDEVGWLLGLQFSIQVIPSGSGRLAQVLTGSCDSVYQQAVHDLNLYWRARIPERAETVLVSIPHEAEIDPWEATARACRSAEKLATETGRIVLLTDLSDFPEELHRQIEATGDADEVLRALTKSESATARSVAALAALANRFRVYLLSQLEQDIVESLYCIPLETQEEARRALTGSENYALLQGGQFAYVDSD